NKGSLDRMQVFRLTDAFNGRDLFALMHRGKAETGIHAPAVDVHGAGTALAVVTTFFRASKVEMFTQRVEKSRAWIELKGVVFAVNFQVDVNRILHSNLRRFFGCTCR